jgi:predicted enzyme related to lactoylglutathione lyase
MAKIVNSRFVLAVRNLEVSTKYYVEVLGFQKDPIDAPGWSFLTRDTVRLMLGECSDAQPAGELGDHSYFAYWNVEGIDDLYREFVSKNAFVTSAPTNKPWGLREFGMTTPDGHRIVCGQLI